MIKESIKGRNEVIPQKPVNKINYEWLSKTSKFNINKFVLDKAKVKDV